MAIQEELRQNNLGVFLKFEHISTLKSFKHPKTAQNILVRLG